MSSLSIVIVNCNYGRFLQHAIDSALAQTGDIREVVVVDDGSTDDSRSIIAAYKDRIVPVLKEMGGHVSAVNAGFEKVTGDLCIFLDADDVLYPDCAHTVLEAWRPGDAKVQYRLETIDARGVEQNMPFPYFPDDLTPESILDQTLKTSWYPWPVSTGNAFARAYLETMLPIDQTVIYRSPDGYLNKLAPLYGQVRTLWTILGAYRVHGANTWAKSGQSWTVATAIRWLKFDRVLEESFKTAAARQGLQIHSPFRPSLQQLEYRLLALRFAPAETPHQSDTPGRLFPLCVSTVWAAANVSFIGRSLWIGWFAILLFAPLDLVRWLFSRSRGQIGRTGLFKRIVAWSKGKATT